MKKNELTCFLNCGEENCDGNCNIWNETKSAIKILKNNLNLSSIDCFLEALDVDSRLIKHTLKLDLKDEKEFFQNNKRDSASNMDFIDILTGDEFETFISELYFIMGYSVEQTSKTRDGGIDIKAKKKKESYQIQCKRYAPKNKVSVNVVRELFGVINNSSKNVKGILISSTDFTVPSENFAKECDIQLINRSGLEQMIKKYIGELPGFKIEWGLQRASVTLTEKKIGFFIKYTNILETHMTNLKVSLRTYTKNDINIDEIFPQNGIDKLESGKAWEYKFDFLLNPEIEYYRIFIQFTELKIKYFQGTKHYPIV